MSDFELDDDDLLDDLAGDTVISNSNSKSNSITLNSKVGVNASLQTGINMKMIEENGRLSESLLFLFNEIIEEFSGYPGATAKKLKKRKDQLLIFSVAYLRVHADIALSECAIRLNLSSMGLHKWLKEDKEDNLFVLCLERIEEAAVAESMYELAKLKNRIMYDDVEIREKAKGIVKESLDKVNVKDAKSVSALVAASARMTETTNTKILNGDISEFVTVTSKGKTNTRIAKYREANKDAIDSLIKDLEDDGFI